jgi:hypothetical protein
MLESRAVAADAKLAEADDFQVKYERLMHNTAAAYERACNARASREGAANGFTGNMMQFAGA